MTVKTKLPGVFASIVAIMVSAQSGAAALPGRAPATPTATGISVPFFGVFAPHGSLKALPAITAAAGARPTVWSVFVKLDSKFAVSDIHALTAARLTPFITLEPWSWRSAGVRQPRFTLASIIKGAHDPAIRHLAQVIRSGGAKVYLRFAHEMNGRWYPWAESVNGNRPGEYVKAWRHVHNLVNAIAPGKVAWVWSPNIVGAHSRTPLRGLYPGDRYVDYLGVSCYGHSGTASSTCAPTLQQLTRLSRRPIILAEMGADGRGQAAWIASLPTLFRTYRQTVGFIYFNTTPASGASGHYQFTDSRRSVSAFRPMVKTVKKLRVLGGAPLPAVRTA